jgi:hypothetical protein
MKKVSTKISVLIIYCLLPMAFFELYDIFTSPTASNIQRIGLSLALGISMAYCNGFKLYKDQAD